METTEKKLLVIAPSDDIYEDAMFYLIDPATGECLYTHICSNSSFAYGDLYGRSKERQEKIKERFGEVEIKFLNRTSINVEELQKKNVEFYKNIEKLNEEKVEIEKK